MFLFFRLNTFLYFQRKNTVFIRKGWALAEPISRLTVKAVHCANVACYISVKRRKNKVTWMVIL